MIELKFILDDEFKSAKLTITKDSGAFDFDLSSLNKYQIDKLEAAIEIALDEAYYGKDRSSSQR